MAVEKAKTTKISRSKIYAYKGLHYKTLFLAKQL